MIIPSIDLLHGQAVQLIGGEKKAIEAGDPRPLARKFGTLGEVALIDLDAALGTGNNAALIEELIRIAPCRVGGGIRSVKQAKYWLDRGARKVILGTMAQPEILTQLPKSRIIVALDARHGQVVVEGWQKTTGKSIIERMQQLKDLADGFLVTFVEREGRLIGCDLQQVRSLIQTCNQAKLTIAGGISQAQEIAELDHMGADAQVGMAIYSGRLGLAEAFCAVLKSDRADGLYPTVVCDELGQSLGLVYSSVVSIQEAIDTQRGVYQSRSRGLWRKGETSGATQKLIRIEADCDRDALRFVVRQNGPGFCHQQTPTCWGPELGLGALFRRLERRKETKVEGSYTQKLLSDSNLLKAKLLEEAAELAQAQSPDQVVWEAADLIYFTLVAMSKSGVSLSRVAAELDRRSLKVTRRSNNNKEA